MTRYPNPVDVLNVPVGESPYRLVMLCEHAGRRMPPHLNQLGVSDADMDRHLAYDIGIDPVVRNLHTAMNIPAVLALYSRLIVDCHRTLDHPEIFWPFEDGVTIPGNQNLAADCKQERLDHLYHPYHRAARDLVTAHGTHWGADMIVLNMHSFTPQRQDGPRRPWEVALSTYLNCDEGMMHRLGDILTDMGVVVGRHEPFDSRTVTGGENTYSAPYHRILVEIRQDLITDASGQAAWAQKMQQALARLCA